MPDNIYSIPIEEFTKTISYFFQSHQHCVMKIHQYCDMKTYQHWVVKTHQHCVMKTLQHFVIKTHQQRLQPPKRLQHQNCFNTKTASIPHSSSSIKGMESQSDASQGWINTRRELTFKEHQATRVSRNTKSGLESRHILSVTLWVLGPRRSTQDVCDHLPLISLLNCECHQLIIYPCFVSCAV